MKRLITFALVLVPLTLVGQGGLNYACVDGTLGSGNCYPGHVHFTGSGTPSTIHINVARSSNGTVYDDFDYDATSGVDFTETLVPADTYNITITGYPYGASQSVTTGGN